MRSSAAWLVLALGWALACEGTSTGNPLGTPPSGGGSGGAGGAMVPGGAMVLSSDVPRDIDPELSTEDASTLGLGNRTFAFDLYRELFSAQKNLFFSPFSISVALAMTYPGAEGDTEAELRSVLHFDLPEPTLHSAFNATLQDLGGRGSELAPETAGTGFELRTVNQAWGQQGYPFLPSYLDVIAQHYGAGLFAVDFADSENTRQLINGWVEDQTETRVKDLLPPNSLSADTRLVLTNAIYFKANWLSQFEVASTSDGVFHAPAAERTLPMMHQTTPSGYAEGADYQALELEYLSPAVRMLFILPAEGQFETVSGALNDGLFQEVRSALSPHTVSVTLPRFQFESENALKDPLMALGMPLSFSPGAADFTALNGGIEELWIDQVYHKAFVAVDEEGTEAAAATAVVIVGESAGPPPAEIVLDRPFIFAIYDEPTRQILFLGHLLDPG